MNDKLLRVAEVADRLGLRVSTIRSWVSKRRIAKVRIGRRAVRIPLSEVNRLITEGTIPVQTQNHSTRRDNPKKLEQRAEGVSV